MEKFPERLGKMYCVDAPRLFNFFFKAICTLRSRARCVLATLASAWLDEKLQICTISWNRSEPLFVPGVQVDHMVGAFVHAAVLQVCGPPLPRRRSRKCGLFLRLAKSRRNVGDAT
jgi:hypothetical protein